jgi:tetratricopeptide (TPR) repeat protein
MGLNKDQIKLLLAVVVLTAIALFPALSAGWTNWDDEVYVIDNELIREFNWQNIKYWFSAYHHGNYHPFTMISYMWEYSISDMQPNGEVKASVFHTTNYILHLLNTALAFIFILKLTNKKEVAAIAAALFGIHPMHVESVAWISERKDVLYTFFYLFALVTYLNYRKSNSLKDYIITVLLFVCSLMSKSAATVFPLTLILIDFLEKRKISMAAIIDKIPLFGLSILFGILAIKSQNATDSIAGFETFTTYQRFMFTSFGALIYPLKFILPIDLTCYHPYPFLVENGTRLPYIYYALPAIFAFLLGIVAWSYKKSRIIIFGFLFYLVNVALVLQFVSVGSAIYAERYSYVAYIGLAYLVGAGLQWGVEKNLKLKPALYGGISVIIIFFSVITYGQTKTWNNAISLWEKFNTAYINNPYGEYKIAEYYMRFDDHNKTTNQFIKITERFPASPRAYAGIGNMKGKQGKYQEALANYNKAENLALQMKVSVAEIYPNRAITFSILKQYDKAFPDYEKAIAADPKNYKIRVNRAFAFLDNKMYKEAVEEYSYVIQFEARNFNHYFLRGIANQNTQDYTNAIQDYTASIQLNTQNANAYHNRAICFEQLKNYKKAFADIQAAQKLGKEESAVYVSKLKGLAGSK